MGYITYTGDEKAYKSFWAHKHTEEKESFMAFLAEHLSKNPHAYIYHYNHYETTALKGLACRYGAYEEQLDNLLRTHRFIDLYAVLRESIRTSESGYSLKNLETFYMNKRANGVSTATDSIIVYNRWRESGGDALLKEIRDYNKLDCISTQLLRDWLLRLRPEGTGHFGNSPGDTEGEAPTRKDWEIEYED